MGPFYNQCTAQQADAIIDMVRNGLEYDVLLNVSSTFDKHISHLPLCLGSARAIHCIVTNLMYSWSDDDNSYNDSIHDSDDNDNDDNNDGYDDDDEIDDDDNDDDTDADNDDDCSDDDDDDDDDDNDKNDERSITSVHAGCPNAWDNPIHFRRLNMRHIVRYFSIDETINLIQYDIYWPISKDFMARKKSWRENVTFGPTGCKEKNTINRNNDDDDDDTKYDDVDDNDDGYDYNGEFWWWWWRYI